MFTEATLRENLNYLVPDVENSSYLLAVSGGADSMVLLNLFLRAGFQCQVAHVNYKLRGADSDADQSLVEDFCFKNKIPVHIYEVSEKDQKPEGSVQLWARNLRYDFFKKIQNTHQLDYLVTAHHLNDQLETFLINLSRAAGLQGLSGIPADKDGIIRPMLSFTKDEIYAFADTHHIAYREDLSNRKNDYLRNFIRNEIAPALIKTNSNFLQNFAKSLSYLQGTEKFVAQQIIKIEKEIFINRNGLLFIDKGKLVNESAFVQFEILRKFGFEAVEEINKIITAPKGKAFRSATSILEVERDFLIIKDLNFKELPVSNEIIIDPQLGDRIIDLKHFIQKDKDSDSISWEIDLSKINLPLKLRKKEAGDIIHPVGMSGSKKVSKFFKDEKLPTFAQQNIWLLSDSKNNILGIVPLRQDRRFAADADCQNKILITL